MYQGYNYGFLKNTIKHLPELMSSLLSPKTWLIDERYRIRKKNPKKTKSGRIRVIRKSFHSSVVQEVVSDILRAWNVLNPYQKRVLELWSFDGLNEDEVGELLGLSQPRTHYIIRSAVRMVQRFLEPESLRRKSRRKQTWL